ncbi:MAG: lysozyme inhibitor LprI family protein [Clostridium sp.]
MNKKKFFGTVIAVIVILIIFVGSFTFVHHEKQIALARMQAETTKQADQAKEAKLKQEQAIKESEAKEQEANKETTQSVNDEQSKDSTKEVANTTQSKSNDAQKQATTNVASQNQTTNQSTQNNNQQNNNQQSNNLSQEKNRLLNELSTLKPDISPAQHYGMLTQSELLYTTWDTELNKIWGILENNLPADKMQALRENEVQWIDTKSPYMPAYKAAGSGDYSQTQSVQAGQTLAQMTKDRCYYLINNYM